MYGMYGMYGRLLHVAQSLATLSLLSLSLALEVEVDPQSAELSCQALLRHAFPDLCELHVVPGTIQVRNLTLAYWRYRAAGAGQGEGAGEGSEGGEGGEGLPLVLAHGGPAFNHHYMLPLKQQACRGREVVFYDQVGCGASSQPADLNSAPWLLTIDYYVEELRALVDALGWKQFHLLGSSWGTVLSQAYAFTQDPRLRAIVLSGPLSDGDLYWRSQWDESQGNLGSLPFFVQATLWELQRRKEFRSKLYVAEDQILTSFFTTRTTPPPDCFNAAKPVSNTSQEIYVGMQGASEFLLSGVLGHFNFTPRLPEIRNPVLLTHGRFDTMRPPVVDALYRNLPRAWKALMPRSGHCSMIDDPRLMNDVVGEFLAREEAGSLGGFHPQEEEETTGAVAAGSAELATAPASLPGTAVSLAAAAAVLAFLCGFLCHWGLFTRRQVARTFAPLLP